MLIQIPLRVDLGNMSSIERNLFVEKAVEEVE
jgi:hypothetical protein